MKYKNKSPLNKMWYYDGSALAMKRFALGTRPHSERVAESLVNVLGGKVLLRLKLCGEPGGLHVCER